MKDSSIFESGGFDEAVSPASVMYLLIVEGLSNRMIVMRELSSRIAASRSPSEGPGCDSPAAPMSAVRDITEENPGCEGWSYTGFFSCEKCFSTT